MISLGWLSLLRNYSRSRRILTPTTFHPICRLRRLKRISFSLLTPGLDCSTSLKMMVRRMKKVPSYKLQSNEKVYQSQLIKLVSIPLIYTIEWYDQAYGSLRNLMHCEFKMFTENSKTSRRKEI